MGWDHMSDMSLLDAFKALGDRSLPCYKAAFERVYKAIKSDGMASETLVKYSPTEDDLDETICQTLLKLTSPGINRDKVRTEKRAASFVGRALINNYISVMRKNTRHISFNVLTEGSEEGDLSKQVAAIGEQGKQSVDFVEESESYSVLEEVVREASEQQRRDQTRQSMSQAFEELIAMDQGRLDPEELYREESGVEDPSPKELRRGRDRVHQRHCRARRRLLEYIRQRAASDPDNEIWSHVKGLTKKLQ
jgi:hypothetical protein